MLPGVEAAAGLLAALYCALAVLHQLAAPPDLRAPLAAMAAGTAAVCLAVWLAVRRGLRPSLAPHAAGLLGLLAAANSLVHLALTRDPLQTSNVMLVLVGIGAVVDDGRWAAGLGALCGGGVLAVASTSPHDPAWVHFAFGLLMAGVLAFLLRSVRQRGAARLDAARVAAARLATHDALTGLLNRRGLDLVGDQILATARRTGRSVVLLFLDLDGLKPVNDTLGHAAGDALLAGAARSLAGAFREADAVARVGGDEFAVLLLGADPDSTDLLCARARRCLAGVTASVGAAVAHEAVGTSLSELLDVADTRMYQEKALKRSAGVVRLPATR
jgi:diguanylate cyclase (GGDEF)-like protein